MLTVLAHHAFDPYDPDPFHGAFDPGAAPELVIGRLRTALDLAARERVAAETTGAFEELASDAMAAWVACELLAASLRQPSEPPPPAHLGALAKRLHVSRQLVDEALRVLDVVFAPRPTGDPLFDHLCGEFARSTLRRRLTTGRAWTTLPGA